MEQSKANKRCSLRLKGKESTQGEFAKYNSNSDDDESPIRPKRARGSENPLRRSERPQLVLYNHNSTEEKEEEEAKDIRRRSLRNKETKNTLTLFDSFAAKQSPSTSAVMFNFTPTKKKTTRATRSTENKENQSKSTGESSSDEETSESDCSEDGDDSEESQDNSTNSETNIPVKTSVAQVPPPPTLMSGILMEPIEPYNLEAYFLANTRQKYRSAKKELLANDCKKGKARKPKKGARGLGGGQKMDSLPERLSSNFSVTKECIRAAAIVGQISSPKHTEESNKLLGNNVMDFARWILMMREGFNIMLHGYGSKIPVVDEFESFLDEENDWLRIKINGLVPKLNPRKAWIDFLDALDLKETIKVKGVNLNTISEEVCQQLPERHSPVFVIVKNLDVLAINQPSFFQFICCLSQIQWVHLLATSDNVNTCLGITQSQSVQLNFCWIPCSTFMPYIEELNWFPNIYGESKGSKGTENTLQYVLKSLTGNARKAFSILASLQLTKLQAIRGRKKEFSGVEFSVLARKCRESFVAHNDNALKTLLVEFVDHKLITNHQGKGKRGANLLTIDLDLDVLERIVKEGM